MKRFILWIGSIYCRFEGHPTWVIITPTAARCPRCGHVVDFDMSGDDRMTR